MTVKINQAGMRRLEAEATQKLNEAWLAEVRATAESHRSATKDEIKVELARRFAALFDGGTLTDAQLEGEAQKIIDHR